MEQGSRAAHYSAVKPKPSRFGTILLVLLGRPEAAEGARATPRGRRRHHCVAGQATPRGRRRRRHGGRRNLAAPSLVNAATVPPRAATVRRRRHR